MLVAMRRLKLQDRNMHDWNLTSGSEEILEVAEAAISAILAACRDF